MKQMPKDLLVVVPREEWSDPPLPLPLLEDTHEGFLERPIVHVVLSYTGTPICHNNAECKRSLRVLQAFYAEKGYYEIPYNFVVGGDGTVYEARGWTRKPWNNPELPTLEDPVFEIAHFGVKGVVPSLDQIEGSWQLMLRGINKKLIKPEPYRHQLFI